MRPSLQHPGKAAANIRRGFSLTELVVVAGLAAAVFTTGALAFRTVTMHQSRTTTFQRVDLGPAISQAFYGIAGGSVDAYTAPNYGMTAQAEVLRNVFWEDVAKATGVFCLPRGPITVDPISSLTDKVQNVNYIHPPVDTSTSPSLPPTLAFTGNGSTLDHPNAFRSLLLTLYPDSPSSPFPFVTYRGVPGASAINGSIYIIQANDIWGKLVVRAVYDIDFLEVSSPSHGVYASVKRYYGTTLTHSYDVLYAGTNQLATDFGPIFACFERKVRKAVTEATSIEAFKRAENRPFYFIWWPDPAMPNLAGTPASSPLASDPRFYYIKHEQQTAWMFTVPIYPSL